MNGDDDDEDDDDDDNNDNDGEYGNNKIKIIKNSEVAHIEKIEFEVVGLDNDGRKKISYFDNVQGQN